jgi:NitT/TauT family transport system substrate-binding protein
MRQLLSIVGVALFCGLPTHADTVRVGELGIVADAPVYIGIESGYFERQHIEVKLQHFTSAVQTTLPLAQGQLEVAGGGMGAGLFNAFARDLPLRIVMARTRDRPGYSSDTLLLRDDLRDTVRTIADLKGRKVAVNAPSGALDYMVGKMMESVGLSRNDLDVSYMPWPDMAPAFANKGIDAGAVTEPFAAQYDARALAFPWKRAAEVVKNPPLEVSVMIYNANWIKAQPDQVRAFAIAYLEGVRDYYSAMRGGQTREAVIGILMKYTALKDKALYDRIQWSYMDPNAELSLASLEDQENWYVKRGAIEKPVEVKDMLDLRFQKYAVEKLGRVEPK